MYEKGGLEVRIQDFGPFAQTDFREISAYSRNRSVTPFDFSSEALKIVVEIAV